MAAPYDQPLDVPKLIRTLNISADFLLHLPAQLRLNEFLILAGDFCFSFFNPHGDLWPFGGFHLSGVMTKSDPSLLHSKVHGGRLPQFPHL